MITSHEKYSLQVLSRSVSDQFIGFMIKSQLGNETSNFVIGHVDQSMIHVEHLQPSVLFECRAKFANSKNVKLNDYFEVRNIKSN